MICTCKDVITCITKILFPFTTGLPYVELLPQRKYNAKNPDSSFNCMSFWNRTNVSLFRCLIHDSRKKNALLGCCCEPERATRHEIALERLRGLYLCEAVTAPPALPKCGICTCPLVAFTLSTLCLGIYVPVLSPLEGRIGPTLTF